MMLPRAVFALVVGAFFSSYAVADATLDRVRAGIAQNTGGKVEVTSVTPTPIPGLFEVVSGTDVFYSDATGRFVFVDGRLVDTVQRQDLTQATLQKVSSIDFKKLPLDLAVKTVIGSGKRQLAVFEDPSCSACRELHGSLAQLTDVTIYHFPLPIISDASPPAVATTLCLPANRRAAKWHAYMSGAEAIPTKIAPGCEPALAKVGQLVALGEQYKIQNTPTIVLGNGQRMVGRVPIDVLSTVLDAAMVQ
jgi:thiol:disulfide interchange protein DsbC